MLENKKKVNHGKEIINKMINSIEHIKSSNENIIREVIQGNNRISEIVKVISEIENKTKIINTIVFQTKLLSFNASVEAARAGEYGRGFSVVTEEVGNLAQMSGNASKEISTMLQSSIDKVKNIIEETKENIENILNISKNAMNKLDTVTHNNALIAQKSAVNAEELLKKSYEIEEMSNKLLKIIRGTEITNKSDISTNE
ncbi:methyl-accepting chemotaxis protein [Fluviispira multicolorata]|uniref:methyl-accepting chemotaxis protein n=1 Tax=Fluviispira multicolorata TaxID=2654512 RepID=UPI001B865E32|nr:methyl-accepting chemotaxis protein [Fluviispira multicolorata]